ncbi:GNAT family N-acetyltransferase [Thaumasiovibrio subtropicus]|uniref:GNAT family N-acetyltransferase n=1 Tax=Thaumasiovibrio subtropicus TaxID=1891207 RepID=UPI000B35E967|nr:GNAT family N-acetyltransferase [Thaumasiovibrio subtropicus]
MNKIEIMREYNGHERQRINAFNGVLTSDKDLSKFVSEDRYGSYISYYRFNENQASTIVKQQLDYFNRRNVSFEWKTYSSDEPKNLPDCLLENGFTQEETESFMVLDLAMTDNIAVEESLITEVSDSQGIRDAIDVQEQVWGGDLEWQYRYLLALKKASPDSISIYVIYDNGQPVTSAWITFNGDSPFAGIWGGSTIQSHRGKGYYSLLLNKRIADAKTRGLKYLTIDASDMSKPIVSNRGFTVIATTTGYTSPTR